MYTPFETITKGSQLWSFHGGEREILNDEGEYWVDGKCALEDFFALYDEEEADDRYESNTVAGWVTEVYGEVPPIGEVLHSEKLEIKIVKANKQKVLKVLSKPLTAEELKEEN